MNTTVCHEMLSETIPLPVVGLWSTNPALDHAVRACLLSASADSNRTEADLMNLVNLGSHRGSMWSLTRYDAFSEETYEKHLSNTRRSK